MSRRRLALIAASVLAMLPAAAQADSVFTGRVSLTGFFYTESDGIDPNNEPDRKRATTANLGFGDLRLTLAALRAAKGRLDFRFDARVRGTGDFDFERKFSTNPDVIAPLQANTGLSLGISSRGYVGGREYDLRELYLLIRATDRFHIQLGRMFVTEADNLKLDGLRFIRVFGPHWDGSVFGGLYSNPYSRSVLTDYVPPCGQGIAGSTTGLATGPCETDGFKLGVVAGVGARYAYDTLWGNIGIVGSFFLGAGDGGQVFPQPGAVAANALTDPVTPNLLGPDTSLDQPRIFVSWLNSWRPAERLDLLSDIVVDVYGSAGPQPTRALLLATIRVVRNDRLTLRLGYSHMSSLAINLYLSRLVYNRQSGTSLIAQGVSAVENNLTVLRTGRDEGRITLDSRFVRRLGGFIEGRIRDRFLINGGSDPSVYNDRNIYGNNTQNLAFDVSGGLRDAGSLKGVRVGLTYSGIFDFRATNHVINFDIGRDFANDRFGFTVNYVLALTQDKVPAGQTAVPSCSPTDPYSSCFGSRKGMTHEAGLTLTASPVRSLFFLLDYRFIALLTDPQNLPGGLTTYPPTLSHAILFRTEYRW